MFTINSSITMFIHTSITADAGPTAAPLQHFSIPSCCKSLRLAQKCGKGMDEAQPSNASGHI